MLCAGLPYLALAWAVCHALLRNDYITAAAIVAVKLLLGSIYHPAGGMLKKCVAAPWQYFYVLVGTKYLLHVVLATLFCREMEISVVVALVAYVVGFALQKYAASFYRPRLRQDGKMLVLLVGDSFAPKVCVERMLA